MRVKKLGVILLYSIILIIPGGGAIIAGYHITKYIQKRRRNAQVHDQEEDGKYTTQLQSLTGCPRSEDQEFLDNQPIEEGISHDSPEDHQHAS